MRRQWLEEGCAWIQSISNFVCSYQEVYCVCKTEKEKAPGVCLERRTERVCVYVVDNLCRSKPYYFALWHVYVSENIRLSMLF